MPNIKSAKKRMRQNKARAAENKTRKSEFRTAVKKALSGPSAETVQTASSLLDRASRKRLIHPNTVARTKSRLAKLANAAAAQS